MTLYIHPVVNPCAAADIRVSTTLNWAKDARKKKTIFVRIHLTTVHQFESAIEQVAELLQRRFSLVIFNWKNASTIDRRKAEELANSLLRE